VFKKYKVYTSACKPQMARGFVLCAFSFAVLVRFVGSVGINSVSPTRISSAGGTRWVAKAEIPSPTMTATYLR